MKNNQLKGKIPEKGKEKRGTLFREWYPNALACRPDYISTIWHQSHVRACALIWVMGLGWEQGACNRYNGQT